MAPKAEELRKQKEKKQKILLIALAPVLLGLLAWQGPKTYGALTAGSAAPPPPAVTTTTTTGPAPTGATTTPTPSGGPTSATNLPDSDPVLGPGTGQLVIFSRFVSKDPFRAKPSLRPSTEDSDSTGETASSAVLEVNGTAEEVEVGESFPADDPAFRLVSATTESVQVGLVSGSFSDGQESITVALGETLVLISDPDDTRYTIKLLSVD